MKFSSVNIISYIAVSAAVSALTYWVGYQNGVTGAQAATGSGPAKSHAAASLTVKAITDPRLAGLSLDRLLHGSLKPDADLLAKWAQGLSPKECLDAMNSLQGLPAGEPRDDILKAVVTALAENDPKGFLASTGSVTNAKLRESGVTSALQKLGADSPKEALDWIKQNAADASTADLSKRYESAMSGFATVDPAGALNAANALADGTRNDKQVKSRAMEGIAEGMSSQGKFTDAIALFNQLPADKFQNDGLTKVADLWAVAAPLDTANWVSNVTNPQLQNDLGQSLTDVWRNTDPQAAAAWAVQIDQAAAAAGATVASNYNGNGNNLDALLTNVIDNWAKTDLNAAGQFLNQLPASSVKDDAIASFASRAAQDNPTAAMGWVATITDPQAQQQAAMSVAKQWVKQDPAALAQFLTTTNLLTPQQMQTLAASLPGNKPATAANGQNSQN